MTLTAKRTIGDLENQLTKNWRRTVAMESTENWAINAPGFWGSIKQLTCCGKCGELLRGGRDKPRRVADMFKPTMHFLCDGCYDGLPE
ncbi:hypothetical protein [Hyphomicrobium sp. ghe19]|uniref:hypothetical protein n=1 Tax=Hyphomicrobium sp. ghe19 TaxID=2682968 RepID=UPI001366B03B|nr:hypothetical protein HYPP_01541 [Hyphomicrobium sp. ghe19]